MKSREPLSYNFSLSPSLNRLRIYRRIHSVARRSAAGSLRYRMAWRANGRRYDQPRLFRVNAFRNPMGRGHGARGPFRCVAS